MSEQRAQQKGLEFERVSRDYDVVIAGARVAGAATAMLLARDGVRVLLVDPRPPTQDTLSTHALMRGGVMQLHRWGLLPDIADSGAPPIRSTIFDYGAERIEVPIKDRDGVSALYAPRRTVLDPILNRAARDAGVDIVYGARLVGVNTGAGGRVRGARVAAARGDAIDVAADLVVGADGRNSRVAHLVDARLERRSRHATASIYGYVPSERDDPDAYRWLFDPADDECAVTMGAIPTNHGEVCLFASTTPEAFLRAGRRGMGELFFAIVERMSPRLAQRARDADPRLRGFPGVRGRVRRPIGPGWALVGDAGHFRDPATAHGITDAVRDAEGLARAALVGSHAAFEMFAAERDAVSRGLFDTTDAIAALDWSRERVQELHHRLSRDMAEGLALIKSWDSPVVGPTWTAPGSARPAQPASLV